MPSAFQPNAFQNQVNYDHFGFQVESATQPVRALAIDQSTLLTADQWELELSNTDTWRARSSVNSVDISTGLISLLDQNELVKHVKQGKIDEWELNFAAGQLTGRMRGRDSAASLLDTSLFISYVTGGVQPPQTPDEDLPPGLQSIPGVTERLFLTGNWTAKNVITDLAERVGLAVSYQAPDYALREDVEVSGPVLGTIHQLLSPFNFFEPFKTDVWVEGKTLMVRQRQGLVEAPSPVGPTPGVLNTITARDLRGQTFNVRANYLDSIRVLRLVGAATGDCSSLNATDPINQQFELEEGGRALRITISGLKRRIDGAELSSQKETYDMTNSVFVSRETTTHTWDALEFDANCRIINNPKHRGSQTLIESMDEDGVIRQSGRVTLVIAYDTDGFVASETTTEEALVDGVFTISKKEVKRLFDNGTKQYREETTIYKADEDGNLTFSSQHTGPGGGHRPGGPGRAPRETIGANTPRAFIAEVIENVPGAKDFSMQNVSLTQDALNTIRDQVKASSGATEYNIEFTAVNIPWLKKGQMLEITGLLYEDGVTPVSLPVFLVYECRVEHTEQEASSARSVLSVKGIFWSKTFGEGS